MKFARLLLAVVSLSIAAPACTADMTAPNAVQHNTAPAPDTTSWQGGTGSGN